MVNRSLKELQDIDLKALIEDETGKRFNSKGHIKCPFHNDKTPSLSIKFFPDKNKYKFKCWGCEEQGDAIDFIIKLKKIEYKEAREYLGMENEKSQKELLINKVKDYIDWQLKHNRKGHELLGIFPFTNENNEIIYFKAKFRKPDGKKETPYYHIENNKVVNNRGYDEIPYNLYNLQNGLAENKVIILVEGEKDANTINNTLRGKNFVATSIKGAKDINIIKKKDMKVYVLGDTGEAGQKYILNIQKEFYDIASEFKIINLPGLKSIGDNKDVTDWLESGHTKNDLLNTFDRSLDLKSLYDLQQDQQGIYKLWHDKKDDSYNKIYLTDFRLIEASRLRFVEEDREGVKLVLKSCTGNILERIGPSTVFDDIKSFKNFLGTMDLSFTSKNIEDLTKLKTWINKYWAIENSEIYLGDKFIEKDNRLIFVTGEGAITTNGIDYSMVSKDGNINIIDKELITKEELMELRERLFEFWHPNKSISIIGTVLNNLAVYQNQAAGEKLHILLIVGESQSGKSTILEKVVSPILNLPLEDKKSIGTTQFALIKDLSTGNYPTIYDEFKPSMMDKYKIQKLSNIFRDVYDRQKVNRGDKSLSIKTFKLSRPLIMAGEESYPNQETAAISRSCIVYLSKNERTQENTEAMGWLMDNQEILNKFGRSIINEILNLPLEQYKEIRQAKKEYFKEFKERAFSTAINIACGIEIFNILLERYDLDKIVDYEKYIFKNIKEEILDNDSDTKSVVEQMLILYNNMIEDCKANDVKSVIREKEDRLFIRTSEMLNQIFLFCKQYESADVIPLKLRDFKKQAMKSGYLIKPSVKLIKVDGSPVRFDEYSKDRIRDLKLDSIVESEFTEITITENEQKEIEDLF